MNLDDSLREYYRDVEDDLDAERRIRQRLRDGPSQHVRSPRWASAVAVCVLVVALAVMLDRLAPSRHRPAALPSTTVSSSAVSASSAPPISAFTGGLHTPGFVHETIISASARGGLLLEAPPGQIRWKLDASCSLDMKWLIPGRGSGSGSGGGCPFAEHLSVGWGAGFGGLGSEFTTIVGRVLPTTGVQVTVTLANGQSATYTPHKSFWLVIVQRCGDVAGTLPRTIVATDTHGHVLARKTLEPPSPHIAKLDAQAC